ncbi:MAG: alpha/beta hydrolase-fold protein [Anaerolineales bacterium]
MDKTHSPVQIPHTEVRKLYSPKIDQEFNLLVALPRSYGRSDQTYPVLYVLDAVGTFGLVTDLLRGLQMAGEAPELLAVGIGYPVDDYIASRPLRARDLTPGIDATFMETHALGLTLRESGLQPGGAQAFLEFMQHVVKPCVQQYYRADASDQAILGGSFGGLFAAWCLLTHPSIFQRYIILSPALWWDDETIFALEKTFAFDHSDLKATIFLSVGGDEDAEMVANSQKLANTLRSRNYAGLELVSHIFKDETHISVVASAVCRGIRVIYDSWQ